MLLLFVRQGEFEWQMVTSTNKTNWQCSKEKGGLTASSVFWESMFFGLISSEIHTTEAHRLLVSHICPLPLAVTHGISNRGSFLLAFTFVMHLNQRNRGLFRDISHMATMSDWQSSGFKFFPLVNICTEKKGVEPSQHEYRNLSIAETITRGLAKNYMPILTCSN